MESGCRAVAVVDCRLSKSGFVGLTLAHVAEPVGSGQEGTKRDKATQERLLALAARRRLLSRTLFAVLLPEVILGLTGT